jgi:hypothetical protein
VDCRLPPLRAIRETGLMPHDREEFLLDEQVGDTMSRLPRAARRLVLALSQTTNPKVQRKLQAKLDALRSSRSAR